MVDSEADLDSEDVDVRRVGTGRADADGHAGAPARPVPTLADRLLDGSRDAILACDHQGVVRTANAAARALLPDVRPGRVLVGPLRDRPADADGAVAFTAGPRRFSGRRLALPDGWTAWFVADVTDDHARLDHLLAERARSRFLAAAGRRLGLSLHPGRTARAVAELAVAELADAAVVVWPAADGGDAVDWVMRRRGADGTERSGRTAAAGLPAPVLDVLRGVETAPRPLLLDDLADVPWFGPLGLHGSRSAAGAAVAGAVTLPGNGAPAGALVLLRHRATGPTASAVDAALVDEFAQRAGIALAAAALYAQQVRTSGVLRVSLAQPPLPAVPGLTLGAVYRPADEGLLIGGDFYDVLPRPGGATTFLLGDVCGKGVDAAVSTGQLRQSVLALRRLVDDPVGLLRMLNATMLETMPADGAPRFVTVVLGTATPRAGGGVTLQLAGGGHLPPLVVRRGGTVERVDIGGMLLGVVPEARFASRRIELAPGESCVLYSDGVTEAQGGVDGRQPFGEERLAEILHGCDVLPAPGVADRVALHATAWLSGGNRDDVAVLVVQAPLPVRRGGGSRAEGFRPEGLRAGRHLHSVPPGTGSGTDQAGSAPWSGPTRLPEEAP